MSLSAIILLVLKISISLNVFAIGLKASFEDATFLLRRPRELAAAILSMNLLMPLLALVLVMLFNLHPAVKIALVAVSVSPVPPFFPKSAAKAGCKANYAIGLLAATAILSIVAVPLAMELFQRLTGAPLSMSMGSILKIVLTSVLLPLIAGIALRSIAPSFAENAAKPVGVCATLLLVLSLLPFLFVSARTILSLIGNGTLLSFAVFAVAGLFVGHSLGGAEPETQRTLAIATASRHPAIAVAIAHANFPDQKLAMPAVLLYLFVSIILVGLYPRLFLRKRASSTEAPGHAAA